MENKNSSISRLGSPSKPDFAFCCHSKLDFESRCLLNRETLNQVQGDGQKRNSETLEPIYQTPDRNTRGKANSQSGRSRIKYGMTANLMGFTLIELLVVVLIIGILASIALPQYKVAKYKADYVKLETIVSSLADAAERYYLANGVYPARFDELDTEFPGAITTEYSTSTYSYRYYGNFPNEGYNLHVNSAGTVYATNQHNSFYIGLKYRQGAWGNCKVCRASSVDKASQTVCEQEAGTKNHQTTGAGSAASSYGLLSNNSMYSYFYQSYGQYAQ